MKKEAKRKEKMKKETQKREDNSEVSDFDFLIQYFNLDCQEYYKIGVGRRRDC